MKIKKRVKTTGFVITIAMCILIALACSKEGDGTNPIASSSERVMEQMDQVDRTTTPAQSATLKEKPAIAIEQAGEAVKQAAESTTSDIESPIADNLEINGTVLSTQNGYVLFADTSQYKVLGKDLSDYVDKNVKITGTLEELGDMQYIHVSTVELIEVQDE